MTLVIIFAVNGVVQNSAEKPKSSQSREPNGPPLKSRTDNGRSNRPTHQEQKDITMVKKYPNQQRDERTESKRVTTEKTNNRYTAEGRTSLNNPREKEYRPYNSESVNHDRPRHENQADDDRQNSRTERSERTERPTAKGQTLRTQASVSFDRVKLIWKLRSSHCGAGKIQILNKKLWQYMPINNYEIENSHVPCI